MTAQISASLRPVSASLADFLRHVERRGAVLAELACGDPVRGDAAVVAAMRALRGTVARAGAGHGADPALHGEFWSLLLAAPSLRQPGTTGQWPAGLAALGALDRGTRAAVLLRLVAGLDDAQGARAMRVAPGTVQRAIERATAHPGGAVSPSLWDSTARVIERHVQHLPADRLARLAAARESVLSDERMRSAPPAPPARWQRPVLATAAGACALLFAATFFVAPTSDDPRIAVAALPDADAPASRYDETTALLTHRDFELLADTRNAALVRQLDFYAWYAARIAASGEAAPILLPDASHPVPPAAMERPRASP